MRHWKGMKRPRLVREYSRRELKDQCLSVKNGPPGVQETLP